MRQEICQQRLGADAACHRDETRPHPCRIGPFSGEYSAVGSEFSSPVGAILYARRNNGYGCFGDFAGTKRPRRSIRLAYAARR
jgi:hypothetical protein